MSPNLLKGIAFAGVVGGAIGVSRMALSHNNPNSANEGSLEGAGAIAGIAAAAGIASFVGLRGLGKSIASGRLAGGLLGTAEAVGQTAAYLGQGTERAARKIFTGGIGKGHGQWLPNWNIAPVVGKDGKNILDLRKFLPNNRIIRRFGALSVPLLGAGAVSGAFSVQSSKPSSIYLGPDGIRHVNDMGASGALNTAMMSPSSAFSAPDIPNYVYAQALDDLALPFVKGMLF